MENIHVKVVNGVLKFYFGDLDVTPFATGPSPSTGQKQRYPGRFVAYLNAHYPLEGKRILEMFSGSGELKEKYGATTTDIRYETGADIVAPYDDLGYKGTKFDIVIADPPYNAGYSNEWTEHADHLPKPKRIQREANKVLRIGGLCMIMHIIQVPTYQINGVESVAYHPLFVGPNNAARYLCVFKKIMELEEAAEQFEDDEPDMPVEHDMMQVAIDFGARQIERQEP